MTTGRDDDALTWDGDDDPTLDLGETEPNAGRRGAEPRPVDAEPREVEPQPEPDRAGAEASNEPTAVLPEGFTAVGKGSERVAPAGAAPDASDARPDSDAAAAEKAPMGNAELIGLGVLGGVFLLFAIGWLIGGLRLQGWRPFLVADAMYQGSLWLAVLAPVLWFATVFLLTRGARAWVRFAWLAAGVVLLVPWPFVMIGAVGQ